MSPDHLARWFEDRRPHFHELARHIVGTPADAADVVQDAFVKALTGPDDTIRSPGAWMTTTVRNLAFDHLRHRRVVQQFAALDDADQAVAPSVEDELGERLEAAAVVRRIVDVLDEQEAVAMLLQVVFDEDHAALARRFGKSEGAMRIALHRARKRVRDAEIRRRSDEDRVARTFAICWQAIVTRDATVLHALVHDQAALSLHDGAAVDTATPPPVRFATVHYGGRYVLALRQGDHLICVLPIGVVGIDSPCAVD